MIDLSSRVTFEKPGVGHGIEEMGVLLDGEEVCYLYREAGEPTAKWSTNALFEEKYRRGVSCADLEDAKDEILDLLGELAEAHELTEPSASPGI